MSETIFAVASGTGRSAVAIIRLSGPGTASALEAISGLRPEARRAVLARLRDPITGASIDHGLVLWFPGPASFTGEDCAEFQIHGGRAVVEALLGSLNTLQGCRMALPGEFTQRAFLNGKMDLTEVEGLADLIDAQTAAQHRQALRIFEGAFGQWVESQRQTLLSALAAAESAIDFADEPDVAGDFTAELRGLARQLDRAIVDQLAGAAAATRIRDGLVVTLAGPPNAGKSTLLNALSRRDAAIVSPLAGTTRDPIEVQFDLAGHLVVCIDTAGLRESVDQIELEGMRRARSRAERSDLVLWLQDAGEPLRPDQELARNAVPVWTVATKLDLAASPSDDADFQIAAVTGLGLPELVEAIRALAAGQDSAGESALVTRVRHRSALEAARRSLAGVVLGQGGLPLELAAEHLRETSQHLDSLLGRIDTDDVLDEIFSRFCIGK